MSSLAAEFKTKKAFVGYLTAGQISLEYTVESALALIDGGVDILEIGVPFSDPIADGPVIQAAMTNALGQPNAMRDIFATIRTIKEQRDQPIVLFSYLNPLLAGGLHQTLAAAEQAGVDGLLVIDMPIDMLSAHTRHARETIAPIGVISPSTPQDRIPAIASHADGFLYYVCRHGTTGIKHTLPADYPRAMIQIQSQAQQPVVCGFGIGNAMLAKAALEHADGFVVGSAFIQAIASGASPADLTQLTQHIDPR
jgi:tryptophan synthase alpha chain